MLQWQRFTYECLSYPGLFGAPFGLALPSSTGPTYTGRQRAGAI